MTIPQQILWHWVLVSFLANINPYMLSCAREIKHILGDSAWRRLLDSHALFPLNFVLYSSSFFWFFVDTFAIINHSHFYNYMLCPVNPPSRSSSTGVVSGTCSCMLWSSDSQTWLIIRLRYSCGTADPGVSPQTVDSRLYFSKSFKCF